MNCCSRKGCDEFFSERVARRDARRYRRRGLDGIASRVVALLRRRDVTGQTLLEVGGGVGAIQLELLAGGTTRATNVELSPAYEPFAADLLRERGLAERVERVVGDFAEDAAEVEGADIVILNRVVCCYPDYRTLVAAAANHTRHQLVLTFPRDVWWMRLALAAVNLFQRLRRQTFRVYLHPPAAIVATATGHGLQEDERSSNLLWQLVAFQRLH